MNSNEWQQQQQQMSMHRQTNACAKRQQQRRRRHQRMTSKKERIHEKETRNEKKKKKMNEEEKKRREKYMARTNRRHRITSNANCDYTPERACIISSSQLDITIFERSSRNKYCIFICAHLDGPHDRATTVGERRRCERWTHDSYVNINFLFALSLFCSVVFTMALEQASERARARLQKYRSRWYFCHLAICSGLTVTLVLGECRDSRELHSIIWFVWRNLRG